MLLCVRTAKWAGDAHCGMYRPPTPLVSCTTPPHSPGRAPPHFFFIFSHSEHCAIPSERGAGVGGVRLVLRVAQHHATKSFARNLYLSRVAAFPRRSLVPKKTSAAGATTTDARCALRQLLHAASVLDGRAYRARSAIFVRRDAIQRKPRSLLASERAGSFLLRSPRPPSAARPSLGPRRRRPCARRVVPCLLRRARTAGRPNQQPCNNQPPNSDGRAFGPSGPPALAS